MFNDRSQQSTGCLPRQTAEPSQDISARSLEQGPGFSFPKPRLLRVKTEYFVASAVWERINGIWSCTRAASVLRWMKGMSTSQARLALLKMGADTQWMDCHIRSNKIRNPALFVGSTVTRTGNIPPPDAPSYEERHQRQTRATARLYRQESKLNPKTSRQADEHPVGRGYKLMEPNRTPRNRRGFNSRH